MGGGGLLAACGMLAVRTERRQPARFAAGQDDRRGFSNRPSPPMPPPNQLFLRLLCLPDLLKKTRLRFGNWRSGRINDHRRHRSTWVRLYRRFQIPGMSKIRQSHRRRRASADESLHIFLFPVKTRTCNAADIPPPIWP